jgi:hypothetical protein
MALLLVLTTDNREPLELPLHLVQSHLLAVVLVVEMKGLKMVVLVVLVVVVQTQALEEQLLQQGKEMLVETE